MKAWAWASSRRVMYSLISSGVARRETAPAIQKEYSGPRAGLISSASARVLPGAAAPPEQPAASRASSGRNSVSLRMAEQVQELLAHGLLVEDAAQGRGHGEGARLLDAAHLDAEVAGLDDHHGA